MARPLHVLPLLVVAADESLHICYATRVAVEVQIDAREVMVGIWIQLTLVFRVRHHGHPCTGLVRVELVTVNAVNP